MPLVQQNVQSTQSTPSPGHCPSPVTTEVDLQKSTPLSLPARSVPPDQNPPVHPVQTDRATDGSLRGRSASVGGLGREARSQAPEGVPPRRGKAKDLQTSTELQTSKPSGEVITSGAPNTNGGTAVPAMIQHPGPHRNGDMMVDETNQPITYSGEPNRPQLPVEAHETFNDAQRVHAQKYATVHGDYSRERGGRRGRPYGQRHYRDKSRGSGHDHTSPNLGHMPLTPILQRKVGPALTTYESQGRQAASVPMAMNPFMPQPMIGPHLYNPGSFGQMRMSQATQGQLRSNDPMYPFLGQIPPQLFGPPSYGTMPYANLHSQSRDPGNIMIQGPLGSHVQAMAGSMPGFMEHGLTPTHGFFEQPNLGYQRAVPPSRDGTVRSHPRKSITGDARVFPRPTSQDQEYAGGSPRHQRGSTSHGSQSQTTPRRSQRSSGTLQEHSPQKYQASERFADNIARSGRGDSEYFGYAVGQTEEYKNTKIVTRTTKDENPRAGYTGDYSYMTMSPKMKCYAGVFESKEPQFHESGRHYQNTRPSYFRDRGWDTMKLYVCGTGLNDRKAHDICASFRPVDISTVRRSANRDFGYCFVR